MLVRPQVRYVALASALLALAGAASALGATNPVPGSRTGRIVQSIGADNLKPAACAGITLTTLISGVTGTSGNDLLLGTSAANTMNGAGGNDCILGGGGNDAITGGAGTDVCIGGPGTDTFTTCETTVQ